MVEKRVTTVTLDGSVKEVKFNRGYPYFEVINMGSDPVYLSSDENITAAADGVYTIPGGSVRVARMDSSVIYVSGSGVVQITAKYEAEISVEGASGGGGEPVDAYTKAESDMLFAKKLDNTCTELTSGDINQMTTPGMYSFWGSNIANLPEGVSDSHCELMIVDNGFGVSQKLVTENNKLYIRSQTGAGAMYVWTRWVDITEKTAIRSTTVTVTTGDQGYGALWGADVKRIPLSIHCVEHTATIFTDSSGAYGVSLQHPDTHNYLVNRTISVTVYYIDKE